MKNNELLQKFVNNKKVLFWTPHLLYINTLLSKHYLNQEIIKLESILLLMLLFFCITTILYFILKKILKDCKYVFYILFFVCLTYFCQFDIIFLLEFAVCAIIIFVILNKLKKNYFDSCVCILIFIILSYFCISTPKAIYSITVTSINTKRYNETYEVNVEKKLETPNIYWIHTDAMMNFSDMQKYFHFYNKALVNYLKEEGYYMNEDASLVAGHKTQKALAALYNPNYYDNHLKDYLYDLEDVYLEKKSNTSYNISIKELINKRIDSELMTALEEKGYTTISISKFNNHSSITTDIMYDYYNKSVDNHWHFTEKEELRKVTETGKKYINLSYTLTQFKEVLAYSILSPYTDNMVPYDYEVIDYNDLDTSEYPNINKTKYWPIKAILKGIEDSQNIDSSKFFFIDYDLNHTQLSYDSSGEILDSSKYDDLNSYVGNYIYSCKLLMEMLDYIRNNDSEAIIVIQADHGLHTYETLGELLNLNVEEVQEIRNSVMNAVYIPEKYQNGDEEYLSNPLNISRYLVNNYVGKNYEYLES